MPNCSLVVTPVGTVLEMGPIRHEPKASLAKIESALEPCKTTREWSKWHFMTSKDGILVRNWSRCKTP